MLALPARLKASIFRGSEEVRGGDLTRLLAVSAAVEDEDARIDLSAYAPPPLEISSFDTQFESGGELIETGRAGPTVLVLGDSFTQHFWQDYFSLHAARYVWMHHEQCGFFLVVGTLRSGYRHPRPDRATDVLQREVRRARGDLLWAHAKGLRA